MPAATVPVAKPAAATKPAAKPAKPAGFTKPAGFSKPAAQELDEEDEKPVHPTIWAIIGVAIAVLLFAVYQQYGIDQTIARVTEPVLGWPSTGDDSGSADTASSASDDEDSSSSAAAEEEESEDEE